MSSPVESVEYERADTDVARPQETWAEQIDRRVHDIRSGTARRELREVLAELDRYEAELGEMELDELDCEPDDLAELESAWADEIQTRIQEIEEGTVPTYAAEDVMAALRARFG